MAVWASDVEGRSWTYRDDEGREDDDDVNDDAAFDSLERRSREGSRSTGLLPKVYEFAKSTGRFARVERSPLGKLVLSMHSHSTFCSQLKADLLAYWCFC